MRTLARARGLRIGRRAAQRAERPLGLQSPEPGVSFASVAYFYHTAALSAIRYTRLGRHASRGVRVDLGNIYYLQVTHYLVDKSSRVGSSRWFLFSPLGAENVPIGCLWDSDRPSGTKLNCLPQCRWRDVEMPRSCISLLALAQSLLMDGATLIGSYRVQHCFFACRLEVAGRNLRKFSLL